MPMFMLISGYLFKYTINKHLFVTIVKSRITTLLIPVIVWHTLYIIINILINGNDCFHLYNFHYSSYLTHLWFLWAVILNSFIILLVHRFFNDSIIVYAIIFILLLFLPHLYNSNYYVFMYPYFLCGYLVNKTNSPIIRLIQRKLFSPYITVMLGICFLLMLANTSVEDYVYVSKTNIFIEGHISFHILYIDFYRWSIGFVGSFLFYRVIHSYYLFFSNQALTTYLISIGTKTMGIYIISDYAFRFFYHLPITGINYFYIIIECLCILSFSFFLSSLISHNIYARKLLLGGR